MNSKTIGLALILAMVVFSIVLSSIFVNQGLVSIKIDPDLTTKGTSFLLTYLLLIAAIERSSAVFVGIQRNPEQKTWQSRVARLNTVLDVEDDTKIDINKLRRVYQREKSVISKLEKDKVINPIESVPEENPTVEEYVGYLTSARQVYRFQLTAYNAQTTKVVTRMVFVAGVFMAGFGLSIFEDILVPGTDAACTDLWTCLKNANVPKLQQTALRLGDVVITGGLIGGGSKSFNAFLNTVDQQLNKTPA